MNLNKTLMSMGIETIRSLNFIEKENIIKKFVKALINAFPEQNIKSNEIISKMYECEMYLAKFPENLGSANYFYKNRAIYFKYGINLEFLDDYMIHELIHYLQDKRDKDGNLHQMGLCYFLEFKIHGMAINEAAVQYITSKVLKHPIEEIEYCKVIAKTISKDYYPLLCNLIMQIVYLLGEKIVIDSTVFSEEDFWYKFTDIVGETAMKEIESSFEQLLDAKQKFIPTNDIAEIAMQEEKMKQLYENVQNSIMVAYFDGMMSLIDTIDETEEYREKIEGYIDILGNVDNFTFYREYKQKQLEKLDKKIIAISRKNSRNMLTVVNTNKIFSIFRNIINFFRAKKGEYRN